MGIAVDYAWSRPSIAALKAAGASGVLRYLAPLTGSSARKVITAAEYRQLRAAGIDVVLNWEYDARDWLGGADRGTQHAAEAVRQARALGYPAGCGIYGSADFDMTRDQWLSGGAQGYAMAFRDGIRAGGCREGVYGPYDVLAWCRELGYRLFWQAGMSTAWSGGRNRSVFPGAHLRQRRTQVIGGADCDVNDILAADWGQVATGGLHMDADVQAAFAAINAKLDALSGIGAPRNEPAFMNGAIAGIDVHALLSQRKTGWQDPAAKPGDPGDDAGRWWFIQQVEAIRAAVDTPGVFTDAQAAAIGAQLAAAVGTRLDDLEHRVEQLAAARLAAASHEAELLAPPSP